MKVPLADLRTQYLQIKQHVDSAMQQVFESSQFILGEAVADFEESFATHHHVKHCIGAGSGTDALHLALWAMGIGKGDSVVTTPFTFIATVEAISLAGATPMFVDIDPKTFNLDPARLQELITSSKGKDIRAIIPVHLYGQPADMIEISQIARRAKIPVVEDACQAHGAKLRKTFVGNFGLAACFSFYPGKNLGAYGEAGAVVTNDDDLAIKLRLLRDHGQVEKYRHAISGHNYRMDGIQGAVLGAKLPHLEKWTERRRSIARVYNEQLKGVGDLVLPYEMPDAYHVYYLYVTRTKQRTSLQMFLAERDIATAIAYPIPLHFQEACRHLAYKKGDFPVSETAAEECLGLPIYAEMKDDQVVHVIETVKAFFSP